MIVAKDVNRRHGRDTNQRREHGRQAVGRAAGTSTWEAAVGALGFILVFATIAFLAYQALTTADKTPSISIEVVAITPTAGGHLVRFRTLNTGGGTAAALRIKGELRRDGRTVERSEVTLDYLPALGEREGALIFQEDPNSYELRLVVEGYADP